MEGGGEGGIHIPLGLNFKYGCSTFCGVGHVPACIKLIFMSFVDFSSSLMSLFLKSMSLVLILP